MIPDLRLSRQLVDCLRRVVGHRFHSQHVGGVGGRSACERLGAQNERIAGASPDEINNPILLCSLVSNFI